MSKKSILIILLLGSSTFAFANLTPVTSEVSLVALANADFLSGNCVNVKDTNSQSQASTLNRLTASVNAVSNCNGGSVSAFAQIIAAWSSPNEGSVLFPEVGWSAKKVPFDAGFVATGTNPQHFDFSYSFQTDRVEGFAVDYSITGHGGAPDGESGLNGFQIILTGPTGNGFFALVNTAGTHSWRLIPTSASEMYTLTITNEANISGDLGTSSAMMEGSFNFHTLPPGVPEPSTLVLLGTGLLAGIVILRRS